MKYENEHWVAESAADLQGWSVEDVELYPQDRVRLFVTRIVRNHREARLVYAPANIDLRGLWPTPRP